MRFANSCFILKCRVVPMERTDEHGVLMLREMSLIYSPSGKEAPAGEIRGTP